MSTLLRIVSVLTYNAAPANMRCYQDGRYYMFFADDGWVEIRFARKK